MKIIHAKDYNDLSRKAANIISAQVILKPESVLGLATGSSPLGVYRQLILWYEKGDLDFAEATSVNLDEYRGLPADNEQSYHYFMHQNFFDHINIDPARIPVSYTHLDVYKRQLFTLIIPNSSFLIPNSHSVVIRWENNSNG